MRKELEARELFGENFTVEPLYDAYGEASFLLGTTELGSAIMERSTGIIYECGQFSPYAGFEACRKYYGGAMSYYVQRADNAAFLELKTGSYEALPLPFLIEANPERGCEDATTSAADSTIKLKNSHFISRFAFGCNVESTCSAVACGLMLNYLKYQRYIPVFTGSNAPEMLDGHYPETERECYLAYFNAETLHQRLLQFNLGAVTFGARVTVPLNKYLNATISSPSKRPIAYYKHLPSFSFVKQEISASRPIGVTTKVFASQYARHTMAVYGCRTVNGANELLVHQGWYDRNYFHKIGRQYEQNDYWLNFGNVWYCYHFAIPYVSP